MEAGALIRALAPQSVTLEDLFFSFTEGDGQLDQPVSRLDPASTQTAAR